MLAEGASMNSWVFLQWHLCLPSLSDGAFKRAFGLDGTWENLPI